MDSVHVAFAPIVKVRPVPALMIEEVLRAARSAALGSAEPSAPSAAPAAIPERYATKAGNRRNYRE